MFGYRFERLALDEVLAPYPATIAPPTFLTTHFESKRRAGMGIIVGPTRFARAIDPDDEQSDCCRRVP